MSANLPGLAPLLDAFQRHVLDDDPAVAEWVRATPALPVARRLAVYHEAYRLRLVEVCTHDYAGLQTLIGEDAFAALVLDYARARPSVYRSARDFSAALPDWLQDEPGRLPAVAQEMLRFERALADALDAADAPQPGTEALAAIDPAGWGELVPLAHPALTRLTLGWDVPALWAEMRAGAEARAPRRTEAPIEWAVWRAPDLMTQYVSLPVAEAAVLDAALAGDDFATICETLCARLPQQEVAAAAVTALCAALGRGQLAGLRTG